MRTHRMVAAAKSPQTGAATRTPNTNIIGVPCPDCHSPAGTRCTTRNAHGSRRRMALRNDREIAERAAHPNRNGNPPMPTTSIPVTNDNPQAGSRRRHPVGRDLPGAGLNEFITVGGTVFTYGPDTDTDAPNCAFTLGCDSDTHDPMCPTYRAQMQSEFDHRMPTEGEL